VRLIYNINILCAKLKSNIKYEYNYDRFQYKIDELNEKYFMDYNYDLSADDVKVIGFDYKKNINLPYDHIQSQLLYYKSKMNINVFGIFDEQNEKINVCIYNEISGTKSKNEIATMLMSYLHNIESNNLILYADNCIGQNKNNYIMQFLNYLITQNYFKSIRLKFMVSGHTHFSVDRGFSWITNTIHNKSMYNINDVYCYLKEKFPVKLFKEFTNYEKLSNYYKNIDNIIDYNEFLFLNNFPDYVFLSKKLIPSIYINRSAYSSFIFKIQQVPFSISEKVSIQEIPSNKRSHLREMYMKGLIPKDYNLDYYCLQSEWNSI